MAQEEIVKILKIDTKDGERSVKGLKDEIKALKDAVLNLDEGTEDYDKAVNRLQKDQRDLDKVMGLTKKGAVALKGSYDDLTHQMALLKKEWKATNDEAKRGEIGKKISEINQKLKDMDEEIGNYQRNVGNYTNSIIDAFEQMNATISEYENAAAAAMETGDVEAYEAAVRGLGETQAKIDKINYDSEMYNGSIEKKLQNLTEGAAGLASGFEIVQSIMVLTGNESEDFEKIMTKMAATMQMVQGLQGLAGIKKGFIAASQGVKALTVAIKALSATSIVGIVLALVAAVGSLTVAFVRNNQATKEAKMRAKELAKEEENLNKQIERNKMINDQLTAAFKAGGFNDLQSIMYAKQGIEADRDRKNASLVDLSNQITRDAEKSKGLSKKLDELFDVYLTENKSANYRADAFAELSNEELAKIESKYGKVGELFVDNLQKFKAARTEYENDIKKIEDLDKEYAQTEFLLYSELVGKDREYMTSLLSDWDQLLAKQEEERELYAAVGYKQTIMLERQAAEREQFIEDEQKKRDEALQSITDRFKTELELLEEKYTQERELLMEHKASQEDIMKLDEEYAKNREEILKKEIEDRFKESDEVLEYNLRALKLNYSNEEEYAKKSIELQIANEEAKIHLIELTEDLSDETRQKMIDNINLTIAELQQAGSALGIDFNGEDYASIENDEKKAGEVFGRVSAGKKSTGYNAQMEELRMQYESERELLKDHYYDTALLDEEYQKNRLALQKEYMGEYIGYTTMAMQDLGSIFGSVAEIYEDDANHLLETGQIKEAEYEKQMEKVKALQIAEATINTISGAVDAYMSMAGIPYVGPALGAAAAAVVTAAGVAQINKIKKTTSTSAPSLGAGQTGSVEAPRVEEGLENNYVRNLTGKSEIDKINSKDNRIYILEQDIMDSLGKAEVRDKERTF